MKHKRQSSQVRMAACAVLAAFILLVSGMPPEAVHSQGAEAALAYVWQDTVVLADAVGQVITETGPTFSYGQGARLFWTPDGDMLYIARDDGLYATGPDGGAAVRVPGTYGRTLTIAQDVETLYYLETVSPQPLDEGENVAEEDIGRVSFPLRERSVELMDGGTGRLAGYFGRFAAGAALADVNFAGALYVRDGGLLRVGRPNLWPTYGSNLFGTCCFPDPGLGLFNVGTGEFMVYDQSFIPGAAAVNLTRTHLAGPTTSGAIRVIDLITGGERDYVIELAGGIGTVERIAWSPDDTYLYIVTRRDPSHPLVLNQQPGGFTVDTRSADLTLYRLNLVTSVIRELAWRPDAYGVSALAATDTYVFAVVVDPNTALIDALNARQVRPGSVPSDPAMAQYMPATHLWRVDVDGDSAEDILDNVWGLAARPIR